jgi:transketolase
MNTPVAEKKPRLTTSAMIASIASEGQRVKAAPFGKALVDAFDAIAAHRGSPSVLICDTRIGRGVPLLETREKAHFMRVAEHEWQIARDQLAAGHNSGGYSR